MLLNNLEADFANILKSTIWGKDGRSITKPQQREKEKWFEEREILRSPLIFDSKEHQLGNYGEEKDGQYRRILVGVMYFLSITTKERLRAMRLLLRCEISNHHRSIWNK